MDTVYIGTVKDGVYFGMRAMRYAKGNNAILHKQLCNPARCLLSFLSSFHSTRGTVGAPLKSFLLRFYETM
jgi:hypothetical protein